MGTKIKMFGAFAFMGFIGFLLGIATYFLCFEALPMLSQVFPQFFRMTWVIWGLTGTFLAVISCLIYAYLL